MTTATPAIANQYPSPQASNAPDPRIIIATGAAFAELLPILGAEAKPKDQPREADADPPAAAQHAEESSESEAVAQTANTTAPAQQTAPAQAAPVTIHALNEMLLRGEGALQRTAQREAKAPAGDDAPRGAASNRPAPAEARAAAASNDTKSESTSPTEPAKAQGAAPSPLAALTRAGELSRSAARTESAAPKPIAPAPTTPSAIALSPTTTAARIATAGRDAHPAPMRISQVGAAQLGAQGPRTDARGVRLRGTTPAGPSQQARAEAFRAQLARGLAAAVEKGRGTVTLRLKPEALGQLQIKVSMKDGVLRASFQAETAQARDLLVSTTGELRRSLEAAGLNVERIEASVPPQLRTDEPGNAPRFDASNGPGDEPGSNGDPSPGRNDSGHQEEKRGTDAARIPEADAAAEPRGGEAEWLVLGVDTIA